MRLLITSSAYVAFGILLAAGASHINNFGLLGQAIREHRLWRPSLQFPLAVGVVGSELLLGAGGLIATLLDELDTALAEAISTATFLLYVAYALYGVLLLTHRPTSPCGCAAGKGPINVWVPLRSGVCAVVSLVLILSGETILIPSASNGFVLAVLVATASGTLLWLLPAALSVPDSGVLVARETFS